MSEQRESYQVETQQERPGPGVERQINDEVAALPPKRVTTLDDLEVVETEVEITRPDGRRLLVPMRSLTTHQLMSLKHQIKWPAPPAKLVQVKGGGTQILKDMEAPEYLEALEAANVELQTRMLLACLQITVPGETYDERVRILTERMGAWAMSALRDAVLLLHGITQADLAAAKKD